jgi:hypothetical protein
MSFRNDWFIHSATIDPVASPMSASKILNPGRRVRAQTAALDSPGNRHLLARLQRGNRLQLSAIFIAKRESIEEIFDGDKADALQIGSPLGPDAFKNWSGVWR